MNKKYLIAVAAGVALALGSCNSDDLDGIVPDANNGTGIELADIGVSSNATTRYDGNTTWDTGDQLIVSGTARNTDATLTTTYTRQADGTWKQDTPANESGNTFLTIENTAAITRIESFGGETTDFGGSSTAPISKAQYLQSDHLLAVGSDITAGATIDKEHRTISATLVHQRADFVLTVSDGSGTLAYTADGSLTNAALRISGTGTGSTPATYWAWNAGKTNAGITTFRVILPDGFILTKVTLYPNGDTDGSGSIDGNDTGKEVTLTGNDGSTTGTGGSGIALDGGKRHTATLKYNEYTDLGAAVSIGDWTEEAYNNGEEVGTGNPPVPTDYVITLAADRTDVTANGLVAVAKFVNGTDNGNAEGDSGSRGEYLAASITLADDLDMTDVTEYASIGTSSKPYTGTYSGNTLDA